MDKIKIVLVDDHSLVLSGFKNILSKVPNFELVGEINNGEDAIQMILALKPDVVLMDINMPIMNGIDCIKEVKQHNLNTKIICLTMHHEEIYVLKAIKAGADGYILKDTEIDELVSAIEHVHNSNSFYYCQKLDMSIKKKINNPLFISDFDEKFNLTTREIEVIKALSLGLNNKEISEKLFISDRTVNTHRTNIMFKMQVKNVVELVVKALDLKFI